MKYKVMIVDDEYLVRELLVRSVDFDKLDCEVVKKASCAAEAYDYLDEADVDIVITDINMPVINGVEMSRVIKAQFPKIKVLILTGFDEFQYAKDSILIGVDDYILKPINENEIEEALERVIQKIDEENEVDLELSEIKRQLTSSIPVLKEKYILDMLRGKIERDELLSNQSFLDIPMDGCFYQVGLIELSSASYDNDVVEEERLLGLYKIKHMLLQDKIRFNKLEVFVDHNDRVLVFSCEPEYQMYDTFSYLSRTLNENAQFNFNAGIGGVKYFVDEASVSFDEAQSALKYKIIAGNNRVICYRDIGIVGNSGVSAFYLEDEKAEEFLFYVKVGLYENAVQFTESYFDTMEVEDLVDEHKIIGQIRVNMTKLISAALKLSHSMGIDEGEVGHEKHHFDRIFEIGCVPEAKTYINEFVKKVMKAISHKKDSKEDSFIEEVKTYIHERVNDNSLTLKGTANAFYMNPSYLSRLYKQKMGVSFKEYLTNLRMNKALDLIRTTDMKVYEIGEAIGIPDPNYFSNCFKKAMNMSVSEYRKEVKNL